MRVLGWILIVLSGLSILGGLIVAVATKRGFAFPAGIGYAILLGIYSLFMFVWAELLVLMIDLEEHARAIRRGTS